uniref:Uncharacterized protein n=1 Tax=Noctiluca scintillans TaxID=2966 RepID=A0A7S1A7A4_NOCSC
MPDPSKDPAGPAVLEVGDELPELRGLVRSLLVSASASSKSATLPTHGFAFTSRTPLSQFGMSYGADHWMNLLCYGVLPASDVSLPLLAALLERVPLNQLPDVFADTDLWLRLLQLLEGNDASKRFAATCVAASLCRAPVFASALFEFGGLAAMGRDGLLGHRFRIALPDLPTLEIPHPAALLVSLQLLAAVAGTIPAHCLALDSVLNWIRQQARPLLDLLQWVAALRSSPGVDSAGWPLAMNGEQGEVLRSISAMAASSQQGVVRNSVLLVLCAGERATQDANQVIVASVLSGGSTFGAVPLADMKMAPGHAQAQTLHLQDEHERGEVVALCCRCALVFVELWSALCVAASRRRDVPVGRSPTAGVTAMAQLEGGFQAMILELLTQASSALSTSSQDTIMQDMGVKFDEVRSSTPPVNDGSTVIRGVSVENPWQNSQDTRLAIVAQILHAWRYDSVTLDLRRLVERERKGGPELACLRPEFDSRTPASPWPRDGAPRLAGDFTHSTTPVRSTPELLELARARIDALCTVFVHSCGELLALRLAAPKVSGSTERGLLDWPHLQFDGSRTQFKTLLLVVEVSLHLIQLHATALVLAAPSNSSAPSAQPPRLALVRQYLRMLQQFSTAVGGAVAVGLADAAVCGPGYSTLPVKTLDLTFASGAATKADRLLAELQSL